jgi:hypothetical protein
VKADSSASDTALLSTPTGDEVAGRRCSLNCLLIAQRSSLIGVMVALHRLSSLHHC